MANVGERLSRIEGRAWREALSVSDLKFDLLDLGAWTRLMHRVTKREEWVSDQLDRPWGHRDFEPTEPALRELVRRAIEASGGSGFRLREENTKISLATWFRSATPEQFDGSAQDYAAADSQAHFLHSCEGSGETVGKWGSAIVAEYGTHRLWPTCFDQRHCAETTWRYAPSHVVVRGMRLYSAAFSRLAEDMGITSIRLYRALSVSPTLKQWLPNVLASASWSPRHANDPGRIVRSAEVHPSVIAGITLGRECHPIIAPFSITAGPGAHAVDFR